jgi:hypothetical protein
MLSQQLGMLTGIWKCGLIKSEVRNRDETGIGAGINNLRIGEYIVLEVDLRRQLVVDGSLNLRASCSLGLRLSKSRWN